jgi:hypothetical protein
MLHFTATVRVSYNLVFIILKLSLLNRLRTKRGEEEGTGVWEKLHNEQLHSLCSSPDVIRIIKSRRMRWAGHVACMRKM